MANVKIYVKERCPYSIRTKQLFDAKRVPYKEIVIDGSPELREEMIRESGRTTTPQVFIDGHHLGGNDDVQRLAQTGELDSLLGHTGDEVTM